MKTATMMLATVFLGTSCVSSRCVVSRMTEPAIASVFVADDGRVFRNRPRLEAIIETLPHSDRYSYLVVSEKESGDPIAVEPLAGWDPKAWWLHTSATDNKLLVVVDGGGTAGPNVLLYDVRWHHENADEPTGPACHFSFLHQVLSDNLVGGRYRIETNSVGYATTLEYEVENLTPEGRFYSKRRVSLEQ